MKRILSIISAAIGLTGTISAQQHFTIGSTEVVPPVGWSEAKRERDRLTLSSADNREHATISIMQFGADASFDDFKRLCQLRIDAEKKGFSDGFVRSEPPFEEKDKFGMFYSGGDKKTGRVFSGYLSLAKRNLVTVYIEGVGIAPKDHLQTFKAFVEGVKRK